MANTLRETSYYELLLWLIGRRKRFQVTGESMLPLLKPGDEILVNPDAYKKALPKINDIIVTYHPDQLGLLIVKRITAIQSQDRYFLTGDNSSASTDSRHWGTVGLSRIDGKVTSIFR